MATNRRQAKGVLISIAFIIVVGGARSLGVDLGRLFMIGLVWLFLILMLLHPVWITVKSTRVDGEFNGGDRQAPTN